MPASASSTRFSRLKWSVQAEDAPRVQPREGVALCFGSRPENGVQVPIIDLATQCSYFGERLRKPPAEEAPAAVQDAKLCVSRWEVSGREEDAYYLLSNGSVGATSDTAPAILLTRDGSDVLCFGGSSAPSRCSLQDVPEDLKERLAALRLRRDRWAAVPAAAGSAARAVPVRTEAGVEELALGALVIYLGSPGDGGAGCGVRARILELRGDRASLELDGQRRSVAVQELGLQARQGSTQVSHEVIYVGDRKEYPSGDVLIKGQRGVVMELRAEGKLALQFDGHERLTVLCYDDLAVKVRDFSPSCPHSQEGASSMPQALGGAADSPAAPAAHVERVTRTPEGLVFSLSDGLQHVVFADKTEVLVHATSKHSRFLDGRGELRCFERGSVFKSGRLLLRKLRECLPRAEEDAEVADCRTPLRGSLTDTATTCPSSGRASTSPGESRSSTPSGNYEDAASSPDQDAAAGARRDLMRQGAAESERCDRRQRWALCQASLDRRADGRCEAEEAARRPAERLLQQLERRARLEAEAEARKAMEVWWFNLFRGFDREVHCMEDEAPINFRGWLAGLCLEDRRRVQEVLGIKVPGPEELKRAAKASKWRRSRAAKAAKRLARAQALEADEGRRRQRELCAEGEQIISARAFDLEKVLPEQCAPYVADFAEFLRAGCPVLKSKSCASLAHLHVIAEELGCEALRQGSREELLRRAGRRRAAAASAPRDAALAAAALARHRELFSSLLEVASLEELSEAALARGAAAGFGRAALLQELQRRAGLLGNGKFVLPHARTYASGVKVMSASSEFMGHAFKLGVYPAGHSSWGNQLAAFVFSTADATAVGPFKHEFSIMNWITQEPIKTNNDETRWTDSETGYGKRQFISLDSLSVENGGLRPGDDALWFQFRVFQ